MIDFETIARRTNGTAAVLFDVQGFDIGHREGAAVRGFAGASSIDGGSAHSANVFDVRDLPLLECLVSFLAILVAPAFYFCAMAGRVLRSSSPCAGGHVAGILLVPLLCGDHVTRHARPASHPSLVVAMWAWLASRVMKFVAPLGGQSRRMPWTLGHAPHRGFDGALGAHARSYGPLGEVAFAARLSREVKALASRLCGSLFRRRFHMLIVMSPA